MPGNVLYRKLVEDMPRVKRGRGFYLELSNGKLLLDLSGGPGAASLGYSNSFVIETLKKQMDKVSFAFSGFWGSDPAEIAGDLLADRFEWEAPGWFSKVVFQGSGSEAADLAMKTAVQYQAEAGSTRGLVAALEYGFHGVTALPYAATGEYQRYALMDQFRNKTRGAHIVRLRSPFRAENVQATLENTAMVFKNLGHQIAAVIIEPVGGPPVGAYPLPQAYLTGIRYLCDHYDTLLIYDEVFCGAGRCGALTTAKLTGVWPDIIILGKSLTGGYQPMSAICLSKKVTERLGAGSGTVMWGTTYGSHTLGCAAVAATQEYVKRRALFERVADEASVFESVVNMHLVEACRGAVKDVHATGFLIGFRLVNPKTGEDFSAEDEFHARVRRAAWEQGVSLYTKGGTIRGTGDFGILAPAFEMDALTFTSGVNKLAAAVNKAATELLEG